MNYSIRFLGSLTKNLLIILFANQDPHLSIFVFRKIIQIHRGNHHIPLIKETLGMQVIKKIKRHVIQLFELTFFIRVQLFFPID